LASILEKEEKMTKNKSIIAGILIKRLNQKIAI
jgi:cell division protein YceG involved in septum cleavage